MSEFDDTPELDLEQRLRDEAAAWGGAPSPECSRGLRAAIESPWARGAAPGPRLRRRLVGAAAAVFVAALVGWAVARGINSDQPEPEPWHAGPEARDAAWWDSTVGPLEREYAALRDDVDAVAGVMWQGVPQRLRSLFGD